MLYFVELDKKYIEILKKIVLFKKYNLNIFYGSFVYLHISENINIFNDNIFNIKFNNFKVIKCQKINEILFVIKTFIFFFKTF